MVKYGKGNTLRESNRRILVKVRLLIMLEILTVKDYGGWDIEKGFLQDGKISIGKWFSVQDAKI